MADYGISTLGVTFGYGVETTAGTKPGTFTQLTRINDIGEISVDTEEIDASEFCQNFNGGGHIRAAGCEIQGKLDYVKNVVIEQVGKTLGC